jgi:WD40 repeat protein
VGEKLGEGGFGDVWLVEHVKTQDRHVAKFCYAVDRLKALKREVTLFRILKQNLGDRTDIGRVLDYQFDSAPYYLEMEYAGHNNLNEWIGARGGANQVPLHERLELIAQAATALAAAHSVGVLHKDIKPSNLMVDESGLHPYIKVIDFGIGALDDRGLLAAKGITATGLTESSSGHDYNYGSLTGTRLYMAPELVEGKPASIKSDIYSLGVILYQVVSGNISQSLATGWQRDISNDLIRQDIEACVDGRPENRLSSAEELARRLRSLDERHVQEEERRLAAQRTVMAHRRRKLILIGSGLVAILFVIAGIFALQQMQRAESEKVMRKRAVQLQNAAEHEKGKAEVALNDAEHLRYIANISLAEAALRDARIDKVQQILLNDTPMEFLGPEWGWLLAQTAPENFAIRNKNIFDAVFSPDGKTFATGDRRDNGEGWVTIYDCATARPIREAQVHSRLIWNMAYSPDGTKLVTASSDNYAKILDVKTLQVLHDLQHKAIVRDAVFSPDNTKVATVARDHTMVIWDVKTGTRIKTFNLPGESPTEVGISSNGKLVAVGTLEGQVHIWNMDTWQEMPPLIGNVGAVFSISFNRSSNQIVASGTNGDISVYGIDDLLTSGLANRDARSTMILPSKVIHMRNSFPISLRSIPGSNKVLVGCDDGTVAIVDLDKGNVVFEVHCDQPLWKLDIAPDAKSVLVASRWSTRFLDLSRLNPPVETRNFGTTEVLTGAIPIKVHAIIKVKDQTWYLDKPWQSTSGLTLAKIAGYNVLVNSFYDTYSPDRSVRIKVDPDTLDGQAILSESGRVVSDFQARNIIDAVFSPDGKYVYIARSGNTVEAYDTKTWQVEKTATIDGWPPEVINETLGISPDGKLLIVGLANGAEEIFSLPDLQHIRTLAPDGGATICMSFSSDGRYLAVGYDSERGRVWDIKTGKLVSVLNGHVRYIHGIMFSPGDSDVLTMSRDGTAKLWDPMTGRELVTIFSTDPKEAVLGCAYTPDGHHVIAVESTGKLLITEMFPWDLKAYDDGTTDSLSHRIERWKRIKRMPDFHPETMEKDPDNSTRSNVSM